ncbi:phytanoyl-CoA dioxygenase family protein [Dehalococcoidia bacterium]|nr:phytanoyl-CoA dioxygenase family protein [Dehalococcoidia bacterium]
MLTAEQITHFQVFGFLMFRGMFSQDETQVISQEADDILTEGRDGQPFAGERQIVMAFVERRPFLASLADDDRIYIPIEDLLGPDFYWIGGDGNLYVGDSGWHSDSKPDPIEYGYTRIKVALYLDPVTKDTGCLRVIPGSHRLPLHEDLEPLRSFRRPQTNLGGKGQDDESPEIPFGVDGSKLPGFPLESQPGDVVFFNQRLWHSSFGGKTGRRMFTLNYGEKPINEDHISIVKMVYEASPGDELYTDAFLNSKRPRIQRMMTVPHELGFK